MISMKLNLKPSTNNEVQNISKACFEWWQKYNKRSNASTDKNQHFTMEMWEEILGWKDNNGEYHKGTFDLLYDRFPCQFTYNMLTAFLMELQARDRGAYPEDIDIVFGGGSK